MSKQYCETCKIEITDANNYSGWCKSCFQVEQNKYKRMCLEQDGIAEYLLSDSELSLLDDC